jgi:hypothetical protein
MLLVRHTRVLKITNTELNMKTIRRHWITLMGICGSGLIIAATALTGLSQTAPVLTIAPLGTNQFSITVTNGISTISYDVLWTPMLDNPNYPWSWVAAGSTGQTNFMINMGVYQTGFFQALMDTNGIPLWEAADPKNQSAGILAVFIDSPTNGAVIQ